jgi:thioredoxin-like negative regulator of GroEL
MNKSYNSFNEIPHLDSGDFKNGEFIHSSIPILVMFYRDGCGYCERMKDVYTKLANHIPCAVIDTSSQRELAQPIMSKFGVQGVPSIILLKNCKFTSVYEGDRSFNDLLNFYNNNK